MLISEEIIAEASIMDARYGITTLVLEKKMIRYSLSARILHCAPPPPPAPSGPKFLT